MNAALLAAIAEYDAIRLAYYDGHADDAEIFQARARVWKLERRLAKRQRLSRAERSAKVARLLRYCLTHRPSNVA